MKHKKGNVLIGIGAVVVLLIIVVAGGYYKIHGNSIAGEDYLNDPLVTKVSELSEMGINSVETLEDYKKFADGINSFIDIINKKFRLELSRLKKTKEAWTKISNSINRYTPLIDNYNKVIGSAKNHESEHTPESYELFYTNFRSFSVEFVFLSSTFVHEATFTIVGKVFGNLGIGKLALSCPICAKTVMSTAYWSLKKYISESATELLENTIDLLEDKLNINIKEK